MATKLDSMAARSLVWPASWLLRCASAAPPKALPSAANTRSVSPTVVEGEAASGELTLIRSSQRAVR